MSKRIETIIAIIAFTLPVWIFILALTFSLLIQRVPGFHQDDAAELVPVYTGQSLSQSITLEQSGLDTVMIFLKNTSLLNQDRFIFNITDSEGGELTSIKLTGYNIGDGDTVKFQFPPLSLLAGSTINVNLLAPDTVKPDTAVKAGVSASNAYPGGGLGGKYSTRDLSFQLFYRPGNRMDLLKSTWSLFWSRL